MWLLLLSLGAHAEMPLPDYDDALARGTWHQLDQRLTATCRFNPRAGVMECASDKVLDEVIAEAEAWQRTVQPDAGLTYLAGLAWRYKGDTPRAKAHWERAVELDADYRAPWYDLGEVYLAEGDFASAERAFTEVGRLTPEGNQSWIAPWRLAEVAAFRQDPDAFERHMRKALRHGFTFDHVAGLPNWKGFLADPTVGPSVEKLITVYGSPADLEALRP